MRTVIIWLWGAGLSSLWWASITAGIGPLIAFAILASIITLIAFSHFCADNW